MQKPLPLGFHTQLRALPEFLTLLELFSSAYRRALFHALSTPGVLPSRVSHRLRLNSSCISTIRVPPFMSLDTLPEFFALFVGALLVLSSPSGLHRERLSCRVFLKEHSKEPKSLTPLIKFTCSSKINRIRLLDYLMGFLTNYSSSSPRLWVPPAL
jgi:hypothetical protein